MIGDIKKWDSDENILPETVTRNDTVHDKRLAMSKPRDMI